MITNGQSLKLLMGQAGQNLSHSSAINQGFLLSRHWKDTPKGIQLTFWASSDMGAIEIILEGQEHITFIASKNFKFLCHLIPNSITWRHNHLHHTNFQQEPMTAIYFKSMKQGNRVRDLLKKNGIELLEYDIRPHDRYLMERHITGALKWQNTSTQQGKHKPTCKKLVKCINPTLASTIYTPEFRIISLDIECSMDSSMLYSIALITIDQRNEQLHQKVVFLVSEPTNLEYVKTVPNEKSLLEEFIRYFKLLDPDFIIGWNVINFDLRLLQRKADLYNIPFDIGRNNQMPHWRKSGGSNDHYTLSIPGRAVLDGIDTLKSATYHFENFSLNAVSEQVLGRGKLIHNVDNRADEISHLYHNDKPALVRYNLEDCQLVWDIFEHYKLIEFVIERANLTGLTIDRFGGSVAAFDNRYLPKLHRSGYIAPNIPENPVGVGSPGGYVMNSMPGIYSHVLVLDFKSLYPSIIRTFKIDPMGLIEGLEILKESSLPGDRAYVEGFNGARFSKSRNLLPDIIDELWKARDRAKQLNNQGMQRAIKIIMNSFYGVLGTPGCRFFDSRLPSSITLRGHEILNQSKQYIESQGYTVIYGDTDSVFVWINQDSASDGEAQAIGKQLAHNLNLWWNNRLKEQFAIKSFLEIEFETHYLRFLMPTIRGSEKGTKKRYAGMIRTQDNQYKLIFKGLESVRSDWTKLARSFQQELYKLIFLRQDCETYIREITENLYKGIYDEHLIYRKRIRRPLESYIKNIPPHVQAAKIADEKRTIHNIPLRYQYGGWVEYVLTVNGPQPIEFEHSALDYNLYLERQIKPVADGILPFIGTSFEEITNKQLRLF